MTVISFPEPPPAPGPYTCRDCGAPVTEYSREVLFMGHCVVCDWLYSMSDEDPAKPKLRAEMVRMGIIAR